MSQRLCAGFNWPPLVVSAAEPISISPCVVSRPGPCEIKAIASSDTCLPLCIRRIAASVVLYRHFSSPATAVGQPESCTACGSLSDLPDVITEGAAPSLWSRVVGVAHPVIPIPDMRGTDARSRKRYAPEGVVQGFQVKLYKVDPSVSVLACNLLSKYLCRTVLCNEPEKFRPQVSRIVEAAAPPATENG